MKLKKVIFAEIVSGIEESLRDIEDMLRYDGAFMRDGGDKNLIAFPTWKTKDGDLNGVITEGRWKSHGVKLQPVFDISKTEDLRQEMIGEPTKWITYRMDSGTPGEWAVFNFREYTLVKDTRKLQQETRIRIGKERCEKCGSPDGVHMERCSEAI